MRWAPSPPIRCRLAQRKECPPAPHSKLGALSDLFLRPEFDKLIKYRPREPRFESVAYQNIGRGFTARSRFDTQRVVGSRRHKFVQIGAEYQSPVVTFALDRHRYGEKGDIVDLDA